MSRNRRRFMRGKLAGFGKLSSKKLHYDYSALFKRNLPTGRSCLVISIVAINKFCFDLEQQGRRGEVCKFCRLGFIAESTRSEFPC